MGVKLEEDNFDFYQDPITGQSIPIRSFTWQNNNNISVQVINYGATITSIKIPDKNGKIDDIVMGFDNMKGYLQKNNPYFGSTIGRNANRIGNGQIRIGDVIYSLTKNRGNLQLHGGNKGFDKVIWEHLIVGNKLILSYHSADLEEGFPGDLIANVSFELTEDNEFAIEFKATTTKPTVVNMTNHSYFNLAGHGKGSKELYKHSICINADKITEVDDNSIPTGVLKPVAGTVFDLQIPKILGTVINSVPGLGYDHNFCINKGHNADTVFIARAHHPESGRMLEVYSNQPGVQFYTANYLPEDATKPEQLCGKGENYFKHGSFCFETQNWPDAPNHANFPNAILSPGQTYQHYLLYKFSIKDD